ncbi:large subunit ribosomal protein L13e [Pancytospora philotis]|nr:large subunit ribosomal protein L13e [Pancytospora philotis]
MKRNNAIPSNHFGKTAIMYKTWFDQPAKATKRRQLRNKKAARVFPMPIEKLRPIVRCPTIRHNRKLRLGRGFTAEECQAAGIEYQYARTIGISVDLRRANQNEESFNTNVQRIKEYMSKIVIYKNKEEALNAGATQHRGAIMPVYNSTPVVKSVSASEVASYN